MSKVLARIKVIYTDKSTRSVSKDRIRALLPKDLGKVIDEGMINSSAYAADDNKIMVDAIAHVLEHLFNVLGIKYTIEQSDFGGVVIYDEDKVRVFPPVSKLLKAKKCCGYEPAITAYVLFKNRPSDPGRQIPTSEHDVMIMGDNFRGIITPERSVQCILCKRKITGPTRNSTVRDWNKLVT